MRFNFFKRPTKSPPHRKSTALNAMLSWHDSGHAVWSGRSNPSLINNGFVSNPIGFRCVKMIAESAASLPLVCQDTEHRFDTHPLLSLIARPNPLHSGAEFFELLYGQILLSGDGYIEAINHNSTTSLHEIYVLRSERMRLITDTDGWPAGYEYRIGNKHRLFDATGDKNPICHIRNFHPHSDHHGFSPLHAAASAIDVHNSAMRWSKALLDNAARPSGAIVYRAPEGTNQMTTEQYERLQSEMETYHQGARNAGRPMLLEGGLDWKQIGFSPSDMEFHKTKDTAARDIALSFGVPPMLLGIPGDATYANYQEANRAFYRLTVIPLAKKIIAGLSYWLSQYTQDHATLLLDFDQIPALAQERETQWRKIASAEFLTNAEKRTLLGLPSLATDQDTQ